MATMRTCDVICNKFQVIHFYKLYLCSVAISSQQQNNNNIIVIIIIIIIIITALEPKVDEIERKDVRIFWIVGCDAMSLGGYFQTGRRMMFGKRNFQQLHWENLKYRKALDVLRETSRFIEDNFTCDAQQRKKIKNNL